MKEGWKSSEIGVLNLFRAVRHHLWRSVKIVVGALAVGIIYLLVVEPHYTATTTMIISRDDVQSVSPTQLFLELDTHALLLDNPAITARVVLSERLFERSEFVPQLGRLSQWLDPGRAEQDAADLEALAVQASRPDALQNIDQIMANQTMQRIIARAQANLKVERRGATRLISLKYTLASPEEAARLSAAYADAYLAFQAGNASRHGCVDTQALATSAQVSGRDTSPRFVFASANPELTTPNTVAADCANLVPARAELQVVSYALVPIQQSWPKPYAILIISLVIGGAIASVLVLRDEWYMFM